MHRNLVTRAVGVEPVVLVDVHAHDLRPGDVVLLCSDGLSDMLPDVVIAQLMRANESLESMARALVDAGQGAERDSFEDRNQGRSRQVRATAAAYLSYFDPEGLGAMTRSCAALPKAVPLFMAVGTEDPIAKVAQDKLYDRAPQNPQSTYVSLPADHVGLASVVGPQLVAWLKGLGL